MQQELAQKGLPAMSRMKMGRVKLRVAFLLLSGLVAGWAAAQTGRSGGSGSVYRAPLAFARAEKLKRGINANEWFAQVYDKRGYTPEHFQAWTTADDIALIKSMGFDHVRLSVNPQPMFNAREPNKIPAEYLGYLDAAVKMILDHGLAVQVKLAAAIREGAPSHTMIAAGARWSDDDELVFQEPVRDPNVIYNFHFYEPHIFTHQGSIWGTYYWHWLRGVRYPSTAESAERVAALVPDEVDRLQVIRYGSDHWDAARIESEMKLAAEWARRRGVPLVCNEFGVYREYADPEDRAAWLHDVRAALERNGIGWAMWDYSGSFGVVSKKDGKAVADDGVLRALGMK